MFRIYLTSSQPAMHGGPLKSIDISMPDMLRKHSYLSEVIFAGSP